MKLGGKLKAPELPKLKLPKIDVQQIAEDFKTLDPKDPGAWPLIPKIIILIAAFFVMLGGAWWFGWNVQTEELTAKEAEEQKLREEWVGKKKQAISLDEYRKLLVEIERIFGELLRQLPNKAEMESLLNDINQAGLGRGLQFELFKPGSEAVKDVYAEQPITLKITGPYHDLGAFAYDVAKMPRIVTLQDIDLADAKEKGSLSMTALAKTFRYLDEEEVARQKKAAKPAAAAAGAKK